MLHRCFRVPRAGLSSDRVVEEAARLADSAGLDVLTLAAVAESLGVKVPSLYKHVGGLPDLRRLLGIRAKRNLASVLAQASIGKSRGDALRAIALAYRDWARTRPGEYAAVQAAPAAEDEDDQQASAAVVQVVFDALAGYLVDEATLIDATRTLRAGLHGFVALEAAGGFALARSLDASFDWWLSSLDAALECALASGVRG